MLIQQELERHFITEQTLQHAKEILFNNYMQIIQQNDGSAQECILFFDDVGKRTAKLDEISFAVETIVFQYDHLAEASACVQVTVRIGAYTARNGVVSSPYGRLILHYNGEPFEEDLIPYSSDYLFML